METVAADVALDLAFSPKSVIADISGVRIKDLDIIKSDRDPYLDIFFIKKKGQQYAHGKMYRVLTQLGLATRFSIEIPDTTAVGLLSTNKTKKFTGVTSYIPFIHNVGLDIILRMIRSQGGTYNLFFENGNHYAFVNLLGNTAEGVDKHAAESVKKAVVNGVGFQFLAQEKMYYKFKSEEEILSDTINRFISRLEALDKQLPAVTPKVDEANK